MNIPMKAMARCTSSAAVLLLAASAHGLTIQFTPQDALASMAIFATGDVIAQQVERRRKRRQPALVKGTQMSAVPTSALPHQQPIQRAASAAMLGAIYGGVMLPFVYQFAESLFPGVSPAKVLAKVHHSHLRRSSCPH